MMMQWLIDCCGWQVATQKKVTDRRFFCRDRSNMDDDEMHESRVGRYRSSLVSQDQTNDAYMPATTVDESFN